MRFAVVGDPVSHSRSPAMHMAGYRYVQVDAVYEAITTPADGFADVVDMLRDGSLNGVNVTMPHKGNAFDAADRIDATVDRLGAANTLVICEGVVSGYNTDIDGVKHAISVLNLPGDTPVHVLGAGGAAAAAIVALEGTRHVSVSTRNDQRALGLCERIGFNGPVRSWGTVQRDAIVINATPLGMHGERLPVGIVASAAGVIDMAYGDTTTPAMAEAENVGIPHADGLVMLAGQAAKAFSIFTGAVVPVNVMESAARTR